MSLSLLTDEQISPVVAEEITRKRSDIKIVSIADWHNGDFKGKADSAILKMAFQEKLTLVSYDLKTILPMIAEWGFLGESHGGILFVDNYSIPSYDKGGLVVALIEFWDIAKDWDWQNVISYLKPVR